MKTNSLIDYFIDSGKINKDFCGGKQYPYIKKDNNICLNNNNLNQLGEMLYNMSDEEILKIINKK